MLQTHISEIQARALPLASRRKATGYGGYKRRPAPGFFLTKTQLRLLFQ